MGFSRRSFLKIAGFTALASAVGDVAAVQAATKPGITESEGMGVLTDISACIGCKRCTIACQEVNGLPVNKDVSELSPNAWTFVDSVKVDSKGERHVKRQCFHCLDPGCVSVCPVGALYRLPNGPVIYDEKKCIGCRYCLMGCAFNVPKYQWDKLWPLVTKCILCYSRLEAGKQPACTEACPVQATIYGKRKDLLKEAEKRIKAAPKKYINHIYGLQEVGGTGFVYISDVPFESLGFPVNMPTDTLPSRTYKVISKIPGIIAGGVVLLRAAVDFTHE
ncbi:MAG: 4Fe-4S dicluster domain-containing protein [Bacillota bacterium]